VNNYRRRIVYVIAMIAVFSLIATGASAKNFRGQRAKNIIFMVPDGMGLSYVTATRIYKNGPDGDRLSFEKFPVIGYQSTHSLNSTVTDSAAAASAWASGAKFNNGEISCHDNDFDGTCDGKQVPTILDIAQSMGKSTGLVATSGITHATPASFGANVHNRKCEEEIARQFLERKIDVLLGGGIAKNRSSCKLTHSADEDITNLVNDYISAGYTLATTKEEMDAAVGANAPRLLGLFTPDGKSPELFRVDAAIEYPAGEPTLPEMTSAALDLLEENRKGFFLMIEGSQIDWSGHANDPDYQMGEMLAFDESVERVLNWVDARPLRRMKTLVVVVADHETGGHAIDGPYGSLSESGNMVQSGWTSTNHSAVDTVIWARGPGSRYFGQALDNTELYYLMLNAMK
jgi:alkaline phosphatase